MDTYRRLNLGLMMQSLLMLVVLAQGYSVRNSRLLGEHTTVHPATVYRSKLGAGCASCCAGKSQCCAVSLRVTLPCLCLLSHVARLR